MNSETIFETEQLIVRKLQVSDLGPYHEMQSNPKVMQYVTGEVQTEEEHLTELKWCIGLYDKEGNDFWIYAIDRKVDGAFVGTLALIKDEQGDDEIGYRFLEKYWGLGYGYDLCKGTITYCRSIGMPKLMGYVFDANIASAKILEKCGFQLMEHSIDPETQWPRNKIQINTMIVSHLEPPYYAVIFTSTVTDNLTEYEATADRMVELAKEQEGYLGIEFARDQVGITVSYWKDLDSITRWKNNVEHTEARNRGREQWYKQYQLRICRVEREYGFTK